MPGLNDLFTPVLEMTRLLLLLLDRNLAPLLDRRMLEKLVNIITCAQPRSMKPFGTFFVNLDILKQYNIHKIGNQFALQNLELILDLKM